MTDINPDFVTILDREPLLQRYPKIPTAGGTLVPKDTVLDYPPGCVQDTNVVATFYLGHPINLKDVTYKLVYVEFIRRIFGAIRIRFTNPKSICLVFATGRVVVAGALSTIAAQNIASQCVRMLEGVGVENISVSNFLIRNRMSTVDMGHGIDLFRLVELFDGCSYDGSFSGTYFKPIGAGVRIGMFTTGKVNIAGSKSVQQTLTHVSRIMRDVVSRCKMERGSEHEKRVLQRAKNVKALKKEKKHLSVVKKKHLSVVKKKTLTPKPKNQNKTTTTNSILEKYTSLSESDKRKTDQALTATLTKTQDEILNSIVDDLLL
ncbi:MAG: hypothetical protein ACTSUE_05235 [Promethearchaeota archaeon]